MMGIPSDITTPFKRTDSCMECGERFKKAETFKSRSRTLICYFDDPWASKYRVGAVHAENDDGHGSCLDKLTDTSWADFRYFTCDHCGRLVSRQCGFNGWRSYVKNVDDEEWCIKCYQEDRLENGEPREIFEEGRLPGDFYSDADLEKSGWAAVVGFSNYHVNGRDRAKIVCGAALNLMDQGLKVLVNYDSMAQGGGEGFVSLYTKKGEE